MTVLPGKQDGYGGMHVVLGAQHKRLSPAIFAATLKRSMATWKAKGVPSVWLRVPQSLLHLCGSTLSNGFELHHAKKGFVMFSAWLKDDGPVMLPPYAHYQIGAAGLVLARDPSDGLVKILVIRERGGPTARLKDFWKLPGGHVDYREDMGAAAVREVREETGIVARFSKVVGYRETHNGPNDTSDMYVVCSLLLDNATGGGGALPTPEIDPAEIAEAKWLPIESFLESRYYAPSNVYGALMQTSVRSALKIFHGEADVGHGMSKLKAPGGKMETLYHSERLPPAHIPKSKL